MVEGAEVERVLAASKWLVSERTVKKQSEVNCLISSQYKVTIAYLYNSMWFRMDEQGSDSFVYLNYVTSWPVTCGTRCPHLCLSHLVATTDWNLYPSVVGGWRKAENLCSRVPLGNSLPSQSRLQKCSWQRLWSVINAINYVTPCICFWNSFNQNLLSPH